ncbi:plant expansin [Coniophora puteana RWD-64-598 SS2]|uniref:Plant expansin n=1 Tax=Coniophora puteana (strain RWD-64-598) TaxID=741705 RepID=A0A5M3MHX6_CONPW|nr:plant expansin [Coniophora puteana RWD-64-598 SS2]EIW78838.1 plant expansin [Coniophora puteana RWD-64-598 SS2]
MRTTYVTTVFALFFAALFGVVSAAHTGPRGAGHKDVIRRSRQTEVAKRDSMRFTYYVVGLGACGGFSNPGQFVVALNAPEFDQGKSSGNDPCWKMVTIWYGGKSTQAQVVDRCAGCPEGGLDFSIGLFSFFSTLGAGVLYGNWYYS